LTDQRPEGVALPANSDCGDVHSPQLTSIV